MKYLSLSFFLNNQYNSKTILLYRFHIITIIVNILATIIDISAKREYNALLEISVSVLLFLNLWLLHKIRHLQIASILFIIIVSVDLFTQIWLSHFGTMSVIFVLLLPLTAMLFIPIRYVFIIEILMIIVISLMLYLEYLYNPTNPIIQNPKALFHLGYAAAIIYVFGLLYHFSILKTFHELDESNKQKALLLKEVYHRVKNNLNVIASIIGLQTASLKEKEKEQLLKSKVRIESIAMVHEMLYRSNDLENIDFEAYVKRLSNLLLRMYGCQEKINVNIHTDIASLPLETMVQMGIMINELITNSVKYAFDKNCYGEILMTLKAYGDNYEFIYQDNGRGIEELEKVKEKNSLGIKLITLTAKQLRGEILIESKRGLKYTIRFPDGKNTRTDR